MQPSYTTTEFLKTAVHTAENFGFVPLHHLVKDPACRNCSTSLPHSTTNKDRRKDDLFGLLTGAIPKFCENKLHAFERPLMVYEITSVPRTGDIAVTFHVFNVQKSIAEALLIQAKRVLLQELGYQNHSVRINSLGDNESLSRFHRELTTFFRKRIESIPPTTREIMKEHVFLALLDLIEQEHELAYKTPNPIEHLSDPSRKHFREMVEYLDMSEAAYEIDPRMIGHHECYSDALFSVDVFVDDSYQPTEEIIVRGGRLDTFMYKHTNNQIPVAGAVTIVRDRKLPARVPRSQLPKPRVYVVQLGFGPKIRSLLLIDELRRNGITVLQNVASDSLSEQLRDAEARGSAYTVIIGQKEFVENSVIIRDMNARNQETIPQDQLVRRLKRSQPVQVT